MKALITIVFLLFTASTTLAQNPVSNDKVNVIEMGIVLVDYLDSADHKKEVAITAEDKVVRLYMHKNSRVTKELSFTTKKDSPKMA